MNRNTQLAAAIASILGGTGSGAALANGPVTQAQAASPTVGLYISGSSAAKNAVLAALETDLCGGSYDLFSSTNTNTNFFAVSCIPATATGVSGANGSNVFTVWYRTEGGSVTGALPLVSHSTINQLNLASTTATVASTTASTTSYLITVTGNSSTNGVDDSFTGGGLIKEPVQYGLTDVEPTKLVKDNYPSAYQTSVYGTATASDFGKLTATTLFQQVFGIFVNTTSANFTSAEKAGQGTATASLSLPKSTVASLLSNGTTDWQFAMDTTGAAVSTTQSVTIVNREAGSGSRTATSIFFLNDGCIPADVGVSEGTGQTQDWFSTGDVLKAANLIPGSISYATIDNAGSTSFPNLTLVALNGVQPTNYNAAIGLYDDWFELTGVTGTTALSANQSSLIAFMAKDFSALTTAPHAADVLAINSASAAALFPVSSTANRGTSSTSTGTTIYVNPFSRGGDSCKVPANQI